VSAPNDFSPHLVRIVDPTTRFLDRTLGSGARWAGRPTGQAVATGWLLTRALMFIILLALETTILNDIHYYFTSLHDASATGIGHALPEYPLPVTALLAIPYLISFGSESMYHLAFFAMMLLIDAMFTRQLFVQQGHRQTMPVTLWLAAAPMLGPLMVTRFDLVPGILVAASILWLTNRPTLSGTAISIGTAVKLWPILALPALAAPLRTRLRVLTGAISTAAVLISAAIAVGGWDRFISPLRYQGDRGLQVEAPISWPLMAAWSVHRGVWTIGLSPTSKSEEISGPGQNVLLALASILTLLALLTIAIFTVRSWRAQRTITPETIALIVFTSVGLIILTNKVFSPQYMLWLAPIAIAALAVGAPHDAPTNEAGDEHGGLTRAAVSVLLVGVLTQVIYPLTYFWVIEERWTNPIGVLLLLIRDITLAYIVYYLGRRAWVRTSVTTTTSQ